MVPDSPSLAFSNQAAMAGLGGIVCFLLIHEILSSRQYMLAGLKKVRDTECSEHTAIRPVVPFLCPPHLLTTLEPIRVLKISVPQKRPLLYCKNLVLILLGGLDMNLENAPSLYTSNNKNKNVPLSASIPVRLICSHKQERTRVWASIFESIVTPRHVQISSVAFLRIKFFFCGRPC